MEMMLMILGAAFFGTVALSLLGLVFWVLKTSIQVTQDVRHKLAEKKADEKFREEVAKEVRKKQQEIDDERNRKGG